MCEQHDEQHTVKIASIENKSEFEAFDTDEQHSEQHHEEHGSSPKIGTAKQSQTWSIFWTKRPPQKQINRGKSHSSGPATEGKTTALEFKNSPQREKPLLWGVFLGIHNSGFSHTPTLATGGAHENAF